MHFVQVTANRVNSNYCPGEFDSPGFLLYNEKSLCRNMADFLRRELWNRKETHMSDRAGIRRNLPRLHQEKRLQHQSLPVREAIITSRSVRKHPNQAAAHHSTASRQRSRRRRRRFRLKPQVKIAGILILVFLLGLAGSRIFLVW